MISACKDAFDAHYDFFATLQTPRSSDEGQLLFDLPRERLCRSATSWALPMALRIRDKLWQGIRKHDPERLGKGHKNMGLLDETRD